MLSRTGGILLVRQMTDAAVATGRVVADRYVVGRMLGCGTMGTVRAAFDLDLDKEVAIKFISTDELSHEETVERFRREVRVAARIKSEHVVRVLDVGSLLDGTPFMVMELLEGHGLDAERDLRGVVPVDEAVGYVLPAIEVLAEAHAQGVVHRDIKPANLFLENRVDEPRFVKVLDFGVSKSAVELTSRESAITKTGMIMGSPLYMAPEQLRSTHAADARADIWSLGAILFELVTGFTAHQGDSVAEICATLLRDPPRPITDFGSELPPGFAEVVMRCLEPDPRRRYSNVAELGAALLPFYPRGKVHVERARRVLAQGPAESTEAVERAPSSDSPVTLHVGSVSEESGERALEVLERADSLDDDTGNFGGLKVARVAMAFALIGIGMGTAFVVELPRIHRTKPAAPAAAANIAPSPPAETPAPAPSPEASPVAPDVQNTALPPAPRRPALQARPLRKAKARPGIARPRTAPSAEVTDFGGRR